MCNFKDVFDNVVPSSWLDPYGEMPLNNGLQVSVDIEVDEKDNVKHITSVKTPPQTCATSFKDVLNMTLSIVDGICEPLSESCQAADLGKCDEEECEEKDGEDSESEQKDKKDFKSKYLDDKKEKDPQE